jgi:hypothetical protein
LETGSGPAFEPALELYRKYGFAHRGACGGYEQSPFNQFLHLDLVSTRTRQGGQSLSSNADLAIHDRVSRAHQTVSEPSTHVTA